MTELETLANLRAYVIAQEEPDETYVRERWETAHDALSRTLNALRDIWPHHFASMEAHVEAHITEALRGVEDAWRHLDACVLDFLGDDYAQALADARREG
jgi:hypothetical protein